MRKIISIFSFIGLLVFQSQAQTTDDVLNLLIQKGSISQNEADSLRAEFAIKQQDIKAKQNKFPVTSGKPFQLSGYTQLRYQSFQKAGIPDGFDIRRARLIVQGDISPTWDYRLQVDFAGTPKIIDAVIAYKPYTFLNFSAGQFVIPFTFENTTSDKILETIDRSQVVNALVARKGDASNGLVDSIGDQNGRDIGVQVSGSFLKIDNRNIIDYAFGVFNGSGINVSDVNEHKDIAGKLTIHPLKNLEIGSSFYSGSDRFTATPKIDQERRRWGAHLNYVYKNFLVRGEYIRGHERATNSIVHEGGYAEAAYFAIPKKLQFVFKYDTYDPNKQVSNDANTYYIFGANYWVNEWAKLQVNYSLRKEEGTSINNDLISAQLQISF